MDTAAAEPTAAAADTTAAMKPERNAYVPKLEAARKRRDTAVAEVAEKAPFELSRTWITATPAERTRMESQLRDLLSAAGRPEMTRDLCKTMRLLGKHALLDVKTLHPFGAVLPDVRSTPIDYIEGAPESLLLVDAVELLVDRGPGSMTADRELRQAEHEQLQIEQARVIRMIDHTQREQQRRAAWQHKREAFMKRIPEAALPWLERAASFPPGSAGREIFLKLATSGTTRVRDIEDAEIIKAMERLAHELCPGPFVPQPFPG